jgi:hypothetical protein
VYTADKSKNQIIIFVVIVIIIIIRILGGKTKGLMYMLSPHTLRQQFYEYHRDKFLLSCNVQNFSFYNFMDSYKNIKYL